MANVSLGTRPRILVIALRRLGDVLLTTPLIRSVRRAWPESQIDALVFADTADILAGNPDLNDVLKMPSRPSAMQSLAFGIRLLRRYDLAISTQSGDRPTGFAIAAGRASLAPVENRFSGRLKHALLTHSVPVVRGLHRVEEILRLADALGIAGAREMVPPMEAPFIGLPVGDYAVIHAAPMFRYKQWTQEGWRVLAQKLAASGLVVIATGGPAESERRYLDEIWMGTNVLRLDGRLSWPQLVGLLAKARVYVGPDTSVTHLAAAAGCPTIGLYGPTDPRLWGPWPKEGLEKPWTDVAPIQRRGNVWLIQHAFPCMPCQLEGCERNVRSDSHCLLSLTPETVVAVVMDALACSVECVEDPLSP